MYGKAVSAALFCRQEAGVGPLQPTTGHTSGLRRSDGHAPLCTIQPCGRGNAKAGRIGRVRGKIARGLESHGAKGIADGTLDSGRRGRSGRGGRKVEGREKTTTRDDVRWGGETDAAAVGGVEWSRSRGQLRLG